MQAIVAVASRILFRLHNHNPFFLVDAIMDELALADHERSLMAVASDVSAVVRLEKEGDFGSL